MFFVIAIVQRYPDNCTPRKIAPQLVLGSGSRLGLVLGLEANRQLPPRKIVPWLGLGFELGLVLGLGQFSLGGAIVLEPMQQSIISNKISLTNQLPCLQENSNIFSISQKNEDLFVKMIIGYYIFYNTQ